MCQSLKQWVESIQVSNLVNIQHLPTPAKHFLNVKFDLKFEYSDAS